MQNQRRKGLERIVVEFEDADAAGLLKKKAFYGRWIVGPKDAERVTGENDVIYFGQVAETVKGNVVVVERREYPEDRADAVFRIYPSFEKAIKDREFTYVVRKAWEKRGVTVEELDI